MEKRGILTKILAIAGTVLAWFPVLVPVIFSVAVSIRSGRLHSIDYLMPAELFLAVLAGGVLLIWAALRARRQLRLMGWGFGLAILLLLVALAIAALSGLASGETEPGGWQSALVMVFIGGYVLAVVAMGIGGILLLGDLFKSR